VIRNSADLRFLPYGVFDLDIKIRIIGYGSGYDKETVIILIKRILK
jgi:hypothetical protein